MKGRRRRRKDGSDMPTKELYSPMRKTFLDDLRRRDATPTPPLSKIQVEREKKERLRQLRLRRGPGGFSFGMAGRAGVGRHRMEQSRVEVIDSTTFGSGMGLVPDEWGEEVRAQRQHHLASRTSLMHRSSAPTIGTTESYTTGSFEESGTLREEERDGGREEGVGELSTSPPSSRALLVSRDGVRDERDTERLSEVEEMLRRGSPRSKRRKRRKKKQGLGGKKRKDQGGVVEGETSRRIRSASYTPISSSRPSSGRQSTDRSLRFPWQHEGLDLGLIVKSPKSTSRGLVDSESESFQRRRHPAPSLTLPTTKGDTAKLAVSAVLRRSRPRSAAHRPAPHPPSRSTLTSVPSATTKSTPTLFNPAGTRRRVLLASAGGEAAKATPAPGEYHVDLEWKKKTPWRPRKEDQLPPPKTRIVRWFGQNVPLPPKTAPSEESKH